MLNLMLFFSANGSFLSIINSNRLRILVRAASISNDAACGQLVDQAVAVIKSNPVSDRIE